MLFLAGPGELNSGELKSGSHAVRGVVSLIGADGRMFGLSSVLIVSRPVTGDSSKFLLLI